MKFAIIGKGFIFERNRQAIEANGGEVVLTCDTDSDKYPDFTDWVEMFNHPLFETVTHVAICTPNYLHAVIAREALRKGKKVISEKPLSINGLDGLEGVNTVLQLRYHPELKDFPRPQNLHIEAKMFRDHVYWNSWKGNDVKSGGILYNLGVHYVDLAVFLLGDNWEIISTEKSRTKVVADIKFGDSVAHIHIEIVDTPKKQGRKMIADGREITLSNQENLSYEDLHKFVYRDFIDGKGIGLETARKSLQLIADILAY